MDPVSFVTDMMELKHIQIKWKHNLTLIIQVLIFHHTYYFTRGCYCCWYQCYQLLILEIEHTFTNICLHQLCTQQRLCKQVHIQSKKYTFYFKIKLFRPWNPRSLVMFHALSLGRHVQGKHLQICTSMCALLNITDCTLLLPQWMGPTDTSLLSMISPHIHQPQRQRRFWQ